MSRSHGSKRYPASPMIRYFRLLYTGQAQTLSEAEEMHLTASLDRAEALAGSSLANEELREHPLIKLFATWAGRGWDDSLW